MAHFPECGALAVVAGHHGISQQSQFEGLFQDLLQDLLQLRAAASVRQLHQHMPGVRAGQWILAAGHMGHDDVQLIAVDHFEG